ncbi:MAG: insulinase family protein, partial [Chloroflexi bacterium]|nr:insulinase family protein [Chloroflexota bacterium]
MESADVLLTTVLDSGVPVVGQPMPGVQSAALGILVGAGARDEQPERAGISHFIDQMLYRGTEHLDARQLSESFDKLGIAYDASAGLEMTLLSAVLLGDRVPAAIDLLCDVLRFPSFPDDAMENARLLLLQELRQREDQMAQKVMDAVRQRFFAGSPLANDSLGNEQSIRSMRRDDLVEYWADRYTANNMVISVAGNVDWDAVVSQLERVTASWPTGRGR